MSLQSALEKAKELHGYFDDIKAGKFKEVYKAENGNYYKDEMYNNSVGVRVILGLNSIVLYRFLNTIEMQNLLVMLKMVAFVLLIAKTINFEL